MKKHITTHADYDGLDNSIPRSGLLFKMKHGTIYGGINNFDNRVNFVYCAHCKASYEMGTGPYVAKWDASGNLVCTEGHILAHKGAGNRAPRGLQPK